MELDWSEQSLHIRTLYAPWQSGNGYEESMILAEEVRLGVRLPDPLRTFYQAWGRRKDLAQTYQHALCGGALHGGWTGLFHHQKFQDLWLEQNWHRTTVGPMAFGLIDEYDDDLPFYVRHGQALAWGFGCSVATCSSEDLDEIGQALQVSWTHRW